MFTCFFINGCNNGEESSPFGEVLTQPPFKVLTDSIRQNPHDPDLYFRRAVLLNKNNFPEPALADFRKAWSMRKEEKYALGISTLWQERKPDSVIAFLNTALAEMPQSILLYISLARAYDQLNKKTDALAACDKALQINPNRTDVLKLKSELLEKNNDLAGAVTTLEKAYYLNPSDVDICFELAYKYAESKNPKTIRLCDSLIQKDAAGVHAKPYYCKGLYYANTGDKAKALDFYNQTIQHDYYFLDAYIDKGKLFFDEKKLADALKVFTLANTLSPAFPDAYYWMGRCQEAMGQKEEAKLNYQRAYGLDKTFTEAKEAADRLSR